MQSLEEFAAARPNRAQRSAEQPSVCEVGGVVDRLTPTASTQPPGGRFPSPAAPFGGEDGGQRYLEPTHEVRLSDKYPAGCVLTTPRDAPMGGGRGSGDVVSTALESPIGSGDSKQRRSRRDVSLDVRLTVADRDAIRYRAQALGVKPSAWARAVMLDALDPRQGHLDTLEQLARTAPPLSSERAHAVEQLRRVGLNLNQAMRRKPISVNDSLLHEVLTAINEVRASFGDGTRL